MLNGSDSRQASVPYSRPESETSERRPGANRSLLWQEADGDSSVQKRTEKKTRDTLLTVTLLYGNIS